MRGYMMMKWARPRLFQFQAPGVCKGPRCEKRRQTYATQTQRRQHTVVADLIYHSRVASGNNISPSYEIVRSRWATREFYRIRH